VSSVWELAVRALHLVGLTLAPSALSPEPLPPPPADLLTHGLAACAVFALVTAAMLWFRRWLDSTQATVAVVLWLGAVVCAFVCAATYRGEGAPLIGGALILMAPLWGTLAAIAAGLAGHLLGSTWKNKRMGAAVLVLVVGVFQLKQASARATDHDRLWADALAREPGHPRAISELWQGWLDQGQAERARQAAEVCLEKTPTACACLRLRSETRFAAKAYGLAAKDAEAAVEGACPGLGETLAVLARARLQTGDAKAAETHARRGLDEEGPAAELNYTLALALDAQSKVDEAAAAAQLAAELGYGSDARLLAGALAIARGELSEAHTWLAPLARQNPVDPRVAYNLALVADRQGDYNAAREGYLRALRADGKMAEARYNVALLTWRAGVMKEAHHHASRFLDAFPADPRGPELARTVGLAPR